MSLKTLITAMALFSMGLAQAEVLHEAGNPETRLIGALQQLTNQEKIEPAISDLQQLVEAKPKFRLAQLVYADMLMARAGGLADFGNYDKATNKALEDLREEARMRWLHHQSPPADGNLPASIVRLSNDQQHIVVVDLGKSRLYLFKNEAGIPRRVDDFYISLGKKGYDKYVEGDKKTPLGIYKVTRFIPDKKLPDFYGSGAFPIDYPNAWDKRLGRTGYGIWLHGTPWSTYSRPPRASDGCVALTNDDFSSLIPFVDTSNTFVVLTESINWIDRQEWLSRRNHFQQQITNWQHDWESLDTNKYLGHYSKEFKSGKTNLQRWSAHKHRVNSAKKFITVDLEKMNIFMYPGEKDMFEVRFTQHYRSSNYNKANNRKRQYWQRNDNGRWQIVYEGPSS